MNTQQIEVYSNAAHQAIIRIPSRKFPGVVVQGDSLSIMVDLAESIHDAIKNSPDEELASNAKQLRSSLDDLLLHYEIVLQEHCISLPHSRRPRGLS